MIFKKRAKKAEKEYATETEKKYASEIEEFKRFENNSTLLVILDCNYGEYRHYIAINNFDKQPYEVYAKVLTMKGPSFVSFPVEIFDKDVNNALRRITYSNLICLLEEQVEGISKYYEGINEDNWESFVDIKDLFYSKKRKLK